MMDAESAFLSRDDQTGTHPSHAATQTIRLGQHGDSQSVTTVLQPASSNPWPKHSLTQTAQQAMQRQRAVKFVHAQLSEYFHQISFAYLRPSRHLVLLKAF